MTNSAIRLLAALLVIIPAINWAARAPASPEALEKNASHIIIGKVIEIASRIEKSKIEKAPGVHQDRVFTITIKVIKAMKGDAVKVGDKIQIEAWQPSKRVPPLPGLQGHTTIPKKDDTAKFYLNRNAGKIFKPILPNGIVIQKNAD